MPRRRPVTARRPRSAPLLPRSWRHRGPDRPGRGGGEGSTAGRSGTRRRPGCHGWCACRVWAGAPRCRPVGLFPPLGGGTILIRPGCSVTLQMSADRGGALRRDALAPEASAGPRGRAEGAYNPCARGGYAPRLRVRRRPPRRRRIDGKLAVSRPLRGPSEDGESRHGATAGRRRQRGLQDASRVRSPRPIRATRPRGRDRRAHSPGRA